MKTLARLAFALSLLAMSACAFTPHTISPVVRVNTATSTVGTGKAVAVEVTDPRMQKDIIGYWGKPDSKNAPVKLAESPAWNVTQAVIQGLAAKGFGQQVKGAKENKLTITLTKLNYENRYDDIWRIGLRVDAQMHAVVTDGKGNAIYERDYSSKTEKRLLRAPSIEDNQKYVGMTLSDMVNSLLADNALVAALAR